MIHKSFNNDNNNEKLEFLGDRVLGLIIAKKLIDIYPNEKEGIIDKKYANLVNKKTCLKIAEKINIKKIYSSWFITQIVTEICPKNYWRLFRSANWCNILRRRIKICRKIYF